MLPAQSPSWRPWKNRSIGLSISGLQCGWRSLPPRSAVSSPSLRNSASSTWPNNRPVPDIHLTDLRKTFPNGAVGIHPTTLDIPDASHFVLLGPSGSGKSTILRLIAGLETPDGGTIHFGHQAVQALPPHERRVAFMTQRPALYPARDVYGNILPRLQFAQPQFSPPQRLHATHI